MNEENRLDAHAADLCDHLTHWAESRGGSSVILMTAISQIQVALQGIMKLGGNVEKILADDPVTQKQFKRFAAANPDVVLKVLGELGAKLVDSTLSHSAPRPSSPAMDRILLMQ